jgi:hypothetical protein
VSTFPEVQGEAEGQTAEQMDCKPKMTLLLQRTWVRQEVELALEIRRLVLNMLHHPSLPEEQLSLVDRIPLCLQKSVEVEHG